MTDSLALRLDAATPARHGGAGKSVTLVVYVDQILSTFLGLAESETNYSLLPSSE